MDLKYPTIHLERMISLDSAQLIKDQTKWLNFSSHDYLGLSHNGELKKNAMKALLQYGVGLASSHMDNGILQYQLDLEETLSLQLGMKGILLSPSFLLGTLLTLHALSSPSTKLFVPDHYPISFTCSEYSNLSHLDKQLERHSSFSKIVIAQFPEAFDKAFLSLVQENQVFLIVDLSDIFGIIDLSPPPEEWSLILGNFAKGMGCEGGFVATSHEIKNDLLRVTKKEWTLSPATLGSIAAGLEISAQMEGERRQLQQRALWLQRKLSELGFEILPSPPHFVRCYQESRALFNVLREHHILAEATDGSITFILNSDHTLEHLHYLVSILSKYSDKSLEVAMQSAIETPER